MAQDNAFDDFEDDDDALLCSISLDLTTTQGDLCSGLLPGGSDTTTMTTTAQPGHQEANAYSVNETGTDSSRERKSSMDKCTRNCQSCSDDAKVDSATNESEGE